MADTASGSADKSVQVKLVLLGMFSLPVYTPTLMADRVNLQAKLQWANHLSFFDSYVAICTLGNIFDPFYRSQTNSNPTKNPLSVQHS